MATVTFIGALQPIAQVASSQIDVYDGAGTYTLTVGAGNLTEAISVAADTDADTTATNLAAAWNASTHPYCKYITASVVDDVVTLTADTAGVPFTVASSAAGGAASMTAISVDTANQSGSDVSLAGNYAGGALAANSDTFIHDANAPALAWGLDQSAKTDITFHSPRGAGNIGLDRMAFAISADGQTRDTSAREYREDYLKMDMSSVFIGAEGGPSLKAAATRIKLNNTRASASATTIYSVAGVSADPGKPTLRLLQLNGTIDVLSASGGWGIAVDDSSETSTTSNITVRDTSGETKTFISEGVLWPAYSQASGTAIVGNNYVTTAIVKAQGGTITCVGSWNSGPNLTSHPGAVIVWGGITGSLNVVSGGGTIDYRPALADVTVSSYVPTAGSRYHVGDMTLTLTSVTFPSSLYTVDYS